jgi:hypothetical protein
MLERTFGDGYSWQAGDRNGCSVLNSPQPRSGVRFPLKFSPASDVFSLASSAAYNDFKLNVAKNTEIYKHQSWRLWSLPTSPPIIGIYSTKYPSAIVSIQCARIAVRIELFSTATA